MGDASKPTYLCPCSGHGSCLLTTCSHPVVLYMHRGGAQHMNSQHVKEET